MTKLGETTRFKSSVFIAEIEKYLGKKSLDFVICNDKRPAELLLKKYAKEGSEFVEPDAKDNHHKIIRANLLDDIHLARHDPDKLAKTIMSIKR